MTDGVVTGIMGSSRWSGAVMRKGEPMNDLIEKLSSLRSQFNCFNENEREAYHALSDAIKAISERPEPCEDDAEPTIEPSAQPERLTDDDFETIRIHLSAYKERLCNQRRWKEAEEYQRIIDRFMSFASAQPDIDEWCHDCKEYDKERHCCPRWNRVIRETLKDAQPEEDCDTCKHGYFGDDKCNNCRVRYPSHYERRTDE